MVPDPDTEPDVDLYAYLLVIWIVQIQIVQILFVPIWIVRFSIVLICIFNKMLCTGVCILCT